MLIAVWCIAHFLASCIFTPEAVLFFGGGWGWGRRRRKETRSHFLSFFFFFRHGDTVETPDPHRRLKKYSFTFVPRRLLTGTPAFSTGLISATIPGSLNFLLWRHNPWLLLYVKHQSKSKQTELRAWAITDSTVTESDLLNTGLVSVLWCVLALTQLRPAAVDWKG